MPRWFGKEQGEETRTSIGKPSRLSWLDWNWFQTTKHARPNISARRAGKVKHNGHALVYPHHRATDDVA